MLSRDVFHTVQTPLYPHPNKKLHEAAVQKAKEEGIESSAVEECIQIISSKGAIEKAKDMAKTTVNVAVDAVIANSKAVEGSADIERVATVSSADENVGTPFDYPTDDSFAESTYDMGTPMDGLYAETDSNTALVPFEGSTAPVEKTANDKLADGIVGLATLLTGGTKKAVKSGGKLLRKAVKAAATAVTVEETDVVEDVETTVVITQQRNNDTE